MNLRKCSNTFLYGKTFGIEMATKRLRKVKNPVKSLIDFRYFVIINTALLLNLIVNEEDNGMTVLLLVTRSLFLISIALYLYFLSQRKKHDVIIQMWACIIVGTLAGLAITFIPVYLGTTSWASIQYSFYLYSALIVYAIWKLSILIKSRRH